MSMMPQKARRKTQLYMKPPSSSECGVVGCVGTSCAVFQCKSPRRFLLVTGRNARSVKQSFLTNPDRHLASFFHLRLRRCENDNNGGNCDHVFCDVVTWCVCVCVRVCASASVRVCELRILPTFFATLEQFSVQLPSDVPGDRPVGQTWNPPGTDRKTESE